MIVSITELLAQLRLEPEDYPVDSPQTQHLTLLVDAAVGWVNHYTGIEWTEENVTPNIKIAILLMVDHLHKNSAATAPVDLKEIPFGVKAHADIEKQDFV
ncbi:head-tail connector protein [Marinibactrum halimedae]|uniref:Phage gp6-like head-tail connector protein n=1 Tax=Marinibactrum halimedae TaxID=1444977 RepID=A0AA37WNP6_9GAMM|nr:head-tail connector protein [Marinibactrum halimedae]MCD9458891.1 head-tail connector protein [Marinibactrum halimedae]GLS27740.1 hypothetical protein GCM10007877_34590 [Marinibactrum halimedae]